MAEALVVTRRAFIGGVGAVLVASRIGHVQIDETNGDGQVAVSTRRYFRDEEVIVAGVVFPTVFPEQLNHWSEMLGWPPADASWENVTGLVDHEPNTWRGRCRVWN